MSKTGPKKGFKNIENLKRERINSVAKMPQFKQLMRECDDQAASYWNQAASDREKGYELWMKKIKKVSHFIDVFKKKDSNIDL